MFYIAQGIGVIALIISMISFQQNTQKRVVTLQIVSSIFFCIHFYMLSAPLGSILNGIGIFRAIVFSNQDKAWASSKTWLFLFCAIFIVVGVFFWDGPISLLPIIAILLTTVSFWVKNPFLVRLISAPSSPLWFIYNLAHRSYPGMITETFVLSSILIAMVRYDIVPRLKRK